MRKHKSTFAMVTAGLILAGCGGMELQRTQGVQASGSEFSKQLHTGYMELSASEYDEGDYRDSDTFAMRARAAASDKPGEPEEIATRKLPKDKVGELSEARGRLMAALAAGARDKAPIQAANAQVMFECWMQEQEENFQPEDIARCRSGFTQALLGAEAAVKPAPVAMRSPEPKMAPAPEPEPVTKKFVVYFPFDSSKLTPESTRTILQAIDAAKELKAKRVYLSGHADRVGTDAYNDKLSEMRANAVAEVIKGGGIPDGALGLGAFGANMNAVKTPPGVKSQPNRRVEILISN